MAKKLHYQTVFLSDIHLGTRGCRIDALHHFFDTVTFDRLYLLGDIIDVWALSTRIWWPREHNRLIKRIFKMAKSGVEVFYIPGNHDELFRDYTNNEINGINIVDQTTFLSGDGKLYLLIHGDMFDVVGKNARWLMHLGSVAYDFMIWLNRYVNKIRKLFGLEYWSLSKFMKHKVKQAVNYIGDFEGTLTEYAKHNGYDGVICGHIHHPEIRNINGIAYINTGDWVDNCTAVVETKKGTLKIYHVKH